MIAAPGDTASCLRGRTAAMTNLGADDAEQAAPQRHAPAWLRHAVNRVENANELDRARAAFGHLAAGLTNNPTVRDVLRGGSFGHAVHPLLTDYPLGAWISVTVLDLSGSPRLRRRLPSSPVSACSVPFRLPCPAPPSGKPPTRNRSALASSTPPSIPARRCATSPHSYPGYAASTARAPRPHGSADAALGAAAPPAATSHSSER